MKDYSMNLEERKDFILGYDITNDGRIKINFAKGKSWYVPYNEENEKIILNKMKKQLDNAAETEKKIIDKLTTNALLSGIFFASTIIFVTLDASVLDLSPYIVSSISSLPIAATLLTGFFAGKNKVKLDDLRKNLRFIEMEKKVNDNVRSEKNVLINVSNKTKKVIKDLPEDKPVFNVNNFNYVPFNDLRQIIENVDRNERFRFVYDEPQQINQPKTKKRKK